MLKCTLNFHLSTFTSSGWNVAGKKFQVIHYNFVKVIMMSGFMKTSGFWGKGETKLFKSTQIIKEFRKKQDIISEDKKVNNLHIHNYRWENIIVEKPPFTISTKMNEQTKNTWE